MSDRNVLAWFLVAFGGVLLLAGCGCGGDAMVGPGALTPGSTGTGTPGSGPPPPGGGVPPAVQAPAITAVVNPEPLLGSGPDVFPSCVPASMRIEGAGFAAGATVLIYRTADGPSVTVGSGQLQPMSVLDPGTIEGECPADPNVDGLVAVTVRVTNPDAQFAEHGAWFRDTGILPGIDISLDVTSNVDPCVAIHPMDSSRVVLCARAEALGLGLSTRVLLARTAGGALQSVVRLGPLEDALADLAERRDPCVAYDAFGRLYLAYVVRTIGLVDTLVLLHSEDDGATWSSPILVAAGLAGQIEGVDLVCGPHPAGGQCALLAWADTVAHDVLCSAWHVATPLAVPLLTGGPHKVDGLLDVRGVAYARAAIAASGAVTVAWVRLAATLPLPTPADLVCATDPDGVGVGALGFGATVVIGPAELGLATPIAASPDLGATAAPELVCVRTGAHARSVAGTVDCRVRISDDAGATWSPDVALDGTAGGDRFQPRLATDPLTGALHCCYADTSLDVASIEVRRMLCSSVDGLTWGPPVALSVGVSTCAPGDGDTIEYGVRCGMAVVGECGWAAWPDNSGSAGDAGGGAMECYACPFQVATP